MVETESINQRMQQPNPTDTATMIQPQIQSALLKMEQPKEIQQQKHQPPVHHTNHRQTTRRKSVTFQDMPTQLSIPPSIPLLTLNLGNDNNKQNKHNKHSNKKQKTNEPQHSSSGHDKAATSSKASRANEESAMMNDVNRQMKWKMTAANELMMQLSPRTPTTPRTPMTPTLCHHTDHTNCNYNSHRRRSSTTSSLIPFQQHLFDTTLAASSGSGHNDNHHRDSSHSNNKNMTIIDETPTITPSKCSSSAPNATTVVGNTTCKHRQKN